MSIKDNYLNPIELAGLYHAAVNGTVSKNDLSETERLQLLKFAKDKKQQAIQGIKESIAHGTITPSMYNYDIEAYINTLYQVNEPQSVIEWLNEPYLMPLTDNSIRNLFVKNNSFYKAEFEKLKIESEAIEPIDGKILFWAKELAKFKQNLSFETLNASGDVVAYTKVNAPLFLDRLIEEEIKYLKTIRDLNAKSVNYETMETKAAKLKYDLDKHGFFNLPMVKQLSEPNKQKLVELIRANKMPYGIAMFDYLGFCKFLFEEHGTWYKADKILSQLYNEKAKDGTSAKHNRRSLVKPLVRYKAGNYKETVKTDYQKLK